MQEQQLASIQIKTWPTPQDYNEAVQNLSVNLRDDELRGGQVLLDRMGLPRPVTGAFASVYRIDCADKSWALRCFLRDISDSRQRYELIADFVQHDDLSYTVAFDYQPEALRSGNSWYPILKMEWIE